MWNEINLNVDIKKKNNRFIEVNQADDIALYINLYCNGQPLVLVEDEDTIIVNYVNANGTVTGDSNILKSIQQNGVNLYLPRNCTNSYGTAHMQVTINKNNQYTNNKQTTSFPIDIKIHQSVVDGKAVSTNINSMIDDITNAAIKGQQVIGNIEDIADKYPSTSELCDNVLSNTNNISILQKTTATKEELDKERIDRKNEIDVERKRIDSLSKLGEGSTTGDAELIDARVGSDGVTYDNVGDAIRGQFNKLNNSKVPITDFSYALSKQLESYVNEIEVNWNESYPYYFNKFATSTDNMYIEFDNMRMGTVSVVPGEIYEVKFRVGYYMSLWSIHDIDGNAITWWNDGNKDKQPDYVVDEKVVIPPNGVELRVYSNVGHANGYVKKYYLNTRDKSPLNGLRVCFVGDSLTDSRTLNGGKNYVDYIAENTGLIAINKGIGGTGYMNTNSGANTTFYQRRTDLPTDADMYIYFGSFNDMNQFTDDTIGTLSDWTETTLIGSMILALTSMTYINPRAIIGVMLPTPWGTYNNTTEEKRTKANKYINALIQVCNKYSIPYLDLYNQSGLRPWDNEFNKLYYLDDNGDGKYTEGVHPNAEGHRKFIAPKVKAFLEKLAPIK